MQVLRKTMTNLLCCFGVQGHDESKHSSSLRRIQASRDSPISMSVPGASVPHALDSPDALQRIFASNSSMRGYHAVQATSPNRPFAHGSLDLSFRFGSESPSKKTRGRLEQLTHHVKQRLSEGRLSRSGERVNTSEAAALQPIAGQRASDIDTDKRLGESHKSLGLTELLASRAPSEGGYDSDTKSMRTPTILSATGALQIRPKNIRKPLAPITGSQVDERPTQLDLNSATLAEDPLTKTCISKLSPLSQTPVRTLFSEALQDGVDQSPDDVLRQLSNSIASSTMKIPTTPELQDMLTSGPGTLSTEWRLALPEPSHASESDKNILQGHHKQTDLVVLRTLRRLAHRICTAKQQAVTFPEKRGLMTGLDPALVDFMDKFAVSRFMNESMGTSPPVTAIKNGSKHPSNEDSTPTPAMNHEQGRNEHEIPAGTSAMLSDSQSLHLFNMRISQKLASNSHIATLSPVSLSNSTSAKSLTTSSPTIKSRQGRAYSAGRAPTFITVEHIRRPSDPETKKLFEPPKPGSVCTNNYRNLSCGSNFYQNGIEKRRVENTMDDSSSYYGSVADGKADEKEVSMLTIRKASLKNPNSFAVGGRSASGPVSEGRRAVSVGQEIGHRPDTSSNRCSFRKVRQLENGSETPQDAAGGRNITTSKHSKFIKVDTTPTPISRRPHSSTDANERMSEIDLEKSENDPKRLGEDTSTQAIEDRRNENLSDIDVTSPSFAPALQADGSQTEDGWLSQGRRTGWGFHFADKTPVKIPDETKFNIDEETNHSVLLNGSADASAIWHKAFQRLGEPHERGMLLATPQFDREGRRKLSMKSVSDQAQPVSTLASSPAQHRRSQSVDLEHCGSFSDRAAQEKRRKSLPIMCQPRFKSMQRKSEVLTKRERLKKASLMDLGRRVISTRVSTETGSSVASKDPFGIWVRFTSHNRAQRNGPAGFPDEVKIRDFSQNSERPYQNAVGDDELTSSPELRSRASWTLLSLKKRKNNRSIPLGTSSAERIRQRRKAFRGRFKRLYRTKSSELYAYAITQGHRSSVSTGQTAEYPELECLPGEGLFERTSSFTPTLEYRVDGISEHIDGASLDTISEVASKMSRSMQSHTIPWSKRDAEEWSKLYRDCVGSLSALRSDNGIKQDVGDAPSTEARRVFSLTSVLRDSTVNFEAELRRDADGAKEKLLQQLQGSGESETGLRMPGSFV